MPKRDIKLYLEDIKTAIRKIEKYSTAISFKIFSKNEKTIDAIIRNLEIIGEAANNIPKEIKTKYPDIPWRKIISMRNKTIHEYFGIDIEIIWQTTQTDIPKLKRKLIKNKLL